ncbi:hypothetical protein [Cellulomonas uda]|uniref:Tail protein n=1 Tax=Cellulomonas uda TaxID=1714 RepID=A0A4Y3K7M2_CELUD|nr:hypothetical protein [Cellulomonas uda]NII67816.1 hypothetical protein [Cellulomonas uda]GEA79937.1 hypothetical protein CUD01_03810 [Cellulomonas uda]
MRSTALADTIDALVATWRTAQIPETEVFDGLQPGEETSQTYIVVGVEDPWLVDQSIDAATSEQTFPLLTYQVRDEQLTIRCVVVAWSGDNDLAPVRAAAVRALDGALEALVEDITLGGVVLQIIGVSNIALRQSYGVDGVVVNIPFTIECQARLAP